MWIFYLSLISSALCSSLVLHEKRDLPLSDGLDRHRIERHALLPMRVGLTQSEHALKKAEEWLMDVSHPDSLNYGRHWTQDEVIDAFKPSEHTLGNVTSWLNSHGIFEFTHSDNQLWFAFDVSVHKAESMLQTEYFEHETSEGVFEASCDQYHLPAYLQSHVHYITPGVKGSDVTGRTTRSRRVKRAAPVKTAITRKKRSLFERNPPPFNSTTSLEHCSREVTPACIRALYNFSAPDPSLSVNPSNSLGVIELQSGLYWQRDLDAFYEHFASDIPAGTVPIFDSIDGDRYPPNSSHGKDIEFLSGETELDLECAIPIIYPQTTTLFEVQGRPAVLPATFPSWHNSLNRLFDAIDGSYCTYEQRGNSSQGGKPRCGIFKPTNVLSMSYGYPEHLFSPYWQDRQCNEWLKLGLQGVSAFICSQDWGVGHLGMWNYDRPGICNSKDNETERIFMPTFPANCPWVTAVGATEIRPHHTVFEPENGAEWIDYDAKTKNHTWGGSSGGGFSLHFETPAYQKDAVAHFLENHNPPWPYFYDGNWRNSTGRYNRNGRGFPDISAVGTHIATYSGTYAKRRNETYVRPEYVVEDGTSAATPIVAAIFNRIVEERLRAGKGPLGFVNPTLYQNPEALNDVVKGANGFCFRENGFQAAPGWDPVTGLGTPNYPKLLDVFMKLP